MLYNTLNYWLNLNNITFFLDIIYKDIKEIEDKFEQKKLLEKFRKIKFKQNNNVTILPCSRFNISFDRQKESLLRFIQNCIINILSRKNFVEISTTEFENIERHFDKLNIALNHPSREQTDTFYGIDGKVLRTQTTVTSSYLIKTAQYYNFFTIGKVYRKDDDPRHLPVFHQLDILVKIDNMISLIDIILYLLNNLWEMVQSKFLNFLSKPEIRIRPHRFPYTDCSFEIDLKCICQTGCDKCSFGWIEILGGGIIKPIVLELNEGNKNILYGAFGMGLERVAIVLYNYLNQNKNQIKNIYDIFNLI